MNTRNRHVRARSAILGMSLMLAAGGAAAEEEPGLVSFRTLSPELALELAQATLAACREKGFQVAVAVTDRSGLLQVLLRDRYAGAHTVEVATRKAWTAVSFRTDTLTMMEETQAGKPQSGVRFISQAMMVGGGRTVEAAGSMVGGIGVSGAPGGDQDDVCAEEGLAALADRLAFL